jgi:hypothetical protein
MIRYTVVCYDESVSGIVSDGLYKSLKDALKRVKNLEDKHPDRNFDETDVHSFSVIKIDTGKAK